MAIIDVVKWDIDPNELCWKYPSDDLRIGTQLVVHPAQTAFFVKGGSILDEFTSGTYTIKSENIPLLRKIVNIPFGKESPFKAEVWFVSQISRLDLKWGTPQPIQLEDPKYGIIVPVRAFGQYGVKVSEPRLFLESLIGNMISFKAEMVDSYFKGKMLSSLSSAISKKVVIDQIPIPNINAYLMDISDFCQSEISMTFKKYGISLIDFSIMSINIPEDDKSFMELKAAMSTRAKMNVVGRDVYQMERSFDVLEKAAGNSGGINNQLMGIGVGMGVGNIITDMAKNNINTSPNPNGATVPPPITQEQTYFAYVDGKQLGGQTIASLQALLAQGKINGETLIWTIGMPNWMPLKSIPSLSGLCPPSIPPSV